MTAIPGRALHYVFKIGDRAKNAFFFRQILGMKVSGSRGAMVGWSVGGNHESLSGKLWCVVSGSRHFYLNDVSTATWLIKKPRCPIMFNDCVTFFCFCVFFSFFFVCCVFLSVYLSHSHDKQVLRHEEFKEGCDAECNGWVGGWVAPSKD